MLIVISALFIIGCPQMLPPETVDSVNVERFTGLWYQIARYYNPAEGDLAAVTAEYSLNDDGTIKVVNRGLVGDLDGPPVSIEGFARVVVNGDGSIGVLNSALVGDLDGPPTSIEGVARVVDGETNAKLALTFDRPDIAGIEFSYWIIELDEDYQYAVVTNDTRFVLYILSRTPTLEDAVYEDLLYRVVKQGFDADRLELTPQQEE